MSKENNSQRTTAPLYKHIELDAPNLSGREKKYLCRCLDKGLISTFGPFVVEFEEKLSRYAKAKRGVSLQSCTAAIQICLHELGIGKGDEVIVPFLTFVATVNPVLYTQAKPVFVDVDAGTWNINPEEIKRAITKRTKAIIPVHLYGNPCNMDAIMGIARKYGLYVIEDAAQALGARYKGRYAGTFGDFGCFSFNGNKVITTGGGGMVVGNNLKRLSHIKYLANQARDDAQEYYHSEMGFNYRMTNIEAALGLAQLERLDSFLAKKSEFNRIYKEELEGCDFIDFQEEYANAISSHWLTCIVFKKRINIPLLQKNLKAKGIPTRRTYMPLVAFPPYAKYRSRRLNNSCSIYERGLCLPGSTLNSNEDIHYVGKTLKGLVWGI